MRTLSSTAKDLRVTRNTWDLFPYLLKNYATPKMKLLQKAHLSHVDDTLGQGLEAQDRSVLVSLPSL